MHPRVDQQASRRGHCGQDARQASPSRPIAPLRSGIVRGRVRPTQIVEEPSNRLLEGLNSLIQAAKRRARGYRSNRNFIAMTMIYLIVGKLNAGPVTA
jgi:transposase